MATIVLTGGGTAGHCTPNLALIPYLKNDFDNIIYIGSEKGIEKQLVNKAGIPFYSVTSAKLTRELTLKNLSIPFKLIKGIKEAEKILEKIKPDVVFSKGGYVAVPTVIAAKRKKIPVISHESDLTVGLANKITAKYCKKVLTSFPETAKSLKNGEYVGSPIRSTLFTAPDKITSAKYFGFDGNKPVLLVTGGSLGAQKINDALRQSLEYLTPDFDVIHICGKGNLTKEKTPQGYYQTEFCDKMEYAFSACSVCVSRAGSNALFELFSLNVPCLLIPLPKGNSRGDQILNAEYFEKKGLCSILYQENLTPKSLALYVNSVYSNRKKIKSNLESYAVKDASRLISNVISSYKR